MKPLSIEDQRRIEDIVKTAGKRLLRYIDTSSLRQKYTNDLASVVTQADIDTEIFLKKELHVLYPDSGFYSEETYNTLQKELEKEYVWVVDPVDGSLNFSRGVPLFGISIALLCRDRPVFGSIYLPYLNEYFSASKGSGAYLNSRRIFIRNADSKRELFGACEIGLAAQKYKQFIDIRSELQFESVHPFCTVYAYAHCAAGHYDFALSIKAALWDIAAAWILVEEAGGKFSTFHDDKYLHPDDSPYDLCCVAGSSSVIERFTPYFKKLVTTS